MLFRSGGEQPLDLIWLGRVRVIKGGARSSVLLFHFCFFSGHTRRTRTKGPSSRCYSRGCPWYCTAVLPFSINPYLDKSSFVCTPANGAENDPNAGRILRKSWLFSRKSWLFVRKSWLFLAGAGRFSIPVCRPARGVLQWLGVPVGRKA